MWAMLYFCASLHPHRPKIKSLLYDQVKKHWVKSLCSAPSIGIESAHIQRDCIKSRALFVNLEQRLVKVRKEIRTRLHFVRCFLHISSSNLLSYCEMYPMAAFPVYSPICKMWCMEHTMIKHLKYSQTKLDDLLTLSGPPTERDLFLPRSARQSSN